MRREEQGSYYFGQDEEGYQPAPHEKTEVDVVPESDEGEDDEEVEDSTRFGCKSTAAATSATATTTERNVEVANDPAIK